MFSLIRVVLRGIVQLKNLENLQEIYFKRKKTNIRTKAGNLLSKLKKGFVTRIEAYKYNKERNLTILCT